MRHCPKGQVCAIRAGRGMVRRKARQGSWPERQRSPRSGWQWQPRLRFWRCLPLLTLACLGPPEQRFANLACPSEAAEDWPSSSGWGDFLPLAGASVGCISASRVITVAVLAYSLHKLDSGHGPGTGASPASRRLSWPTVVPRHINDSISSRGSRKLARQVLGGDAKVVDGVVQPLHRPCLTRQRRRVQVLETGRAPFYH